MSDIIRDSALGQLVRLFTHNRFLLYPEEQPDFVVPDAYAFPGAVTKETPSSIQPSDSESGDEIPRPTHQQNEVLTAQRTQTHPIAPVVTATGDILVDWYDTEDQANPQNWSKKKRAWIALVTCAYTFVVYAGSAIYTTGELDIMQKLGLSYVEASLPLSLYVLAYGIGPLLFSPVSEIAYFGRMPVYAITMFIFVVLSGPTAVVNNFSGLLALRFFQGFFGSPCLATGGATMQDMYSLVKLPYALTAWVAAAFCGPALGPLISGFAVMRNGWHWSLWPILWSSGFILIFMLTLFPETSGPTILLRRAERLRKLTGNNSIRSQSEIDAKNTTAVDVFVDAVWKPLEITLKDPAIAFVNLYTALTYGIYYSFFEVFPLVYSGLYGFSIGLIGVVFTCILVSCVLGIAVYVAYQYFYLVPDITKNGFRAQEHRLVPALFAAFGPPIGLFIFAWTSRADVHWIAPTIGITIYGFSVFILMQCIFVYVPFTYPKYAASLFAANDFLRSALACGSILFARPLFINLGIGRGVSLLGGLSTIGVLGIFVLYFKGAELRKRSKFAI